jgi:hypothetical protein
MQKKSTRGHDALPQDPSHKKLSIIFTLLIGISETVHGNDPRNKKVSLAFRKMWAAADKKRP